MGSRNRKLAVGAAVIVLAGVVFWLGTRGGSEPVHQGKKVSEWFEIYVASAGKSEEATAAFRALGAEAVPFLVSRLGVDSTFRSTHARVRSFSSWTHKQIKPEAKVDWNRRTLAIRALGELGEAASNAIPALIFAITNFVEVSVDPSGGSRFGQLREQGGQIAPAGIGALAKIGPRSPAVSQALTNILAQPPEQDSARSTAALKALALLTPPAAEIPGIIEVLRRREVPLSLWFSGHSVPRDLNGWLALVRQVKPGEHHESLAYSFGYATALSPADRQKLIAELVPLHRRLSGQQMFLLQESIVMLDPAAGREVLVYLVNQTEFQQFDLRLRALESLRRMGPLALERGQGNVDYRAKEYVEKRLKDEVPVVRLWAQETLKALGQSSDGTQTIR